MKYKTKSYLISQMIKDYEKDVGESNRLVFDFAIQRPEGQWDNDSQSLLIHSILQEYIVPDIYIVQSRDDDFEPMWVLDGKQRMTIIYNYCTNGFKLANTTPPVEVIVPEFDKKGNLLKDENGVTKTHTKFIEIKNKKFFDLSKEFQNKIKNFELNVIMITEASKRELEEQIFRLNNSKTPASIHKAFMKSGIAITEAIKNKLICNSFFLNRFNMTIAQEKKEEDMKCAFHVLVLLTNASFNRLTNGNLEKVAENMKRNWNVGEFSDNDIEYCSKLLEELDYFLPDERYFDSKMILTTVHVPILVMNVEKAKQMIDDKELTVERYKEFLRYWVTKGFYNDEYQKYLSRSTDEKQNIENRIALMEKELNNFIL